MSLEAKKKQAILNLKYSDSPEMELMILGNELEQIERTIEDPEGYARTAPLSPLLHERISKFIKEECTRRKTEIQLRKGALKC